MIDDCHCPAVVEDDDDGGGSRSPTAYIDYDKKLEQVKEHNHGGSLPLERERMSSQVGSAAGY
jgi:hypothetical protein